MNAHRWPVALGLFAVGALVALGMPEGSLAAHPTGLVTPEQAQGVGNPTLTRVECLSCHATHGAVDEDLLAGRDHAGTVCVACHKNLDLKAHAGSHPLDTVVPRRAVEAVQKLGGQVGANNTIVCVSCHTVHQDAEIGPRCFACHDDQASVALNDTDAGHRSAVCTDCHNTSSARAKISATRVEGDPSNCLRCHGEGSKNQPVDVHPGQIGHALVDREGGFGPSDPPLNGCVTCHGGHEVVRPDAQLCEKCHDDQAAAHARGGHGPATCLDCHPAHEARVLHADGTDHAINPISRRCLACHAPDSPGDAEVPRVEAFEHPAAVFTPDGKRWEPLGALPLFTDAGLKVAATESGALTCATCHLPHGPDPERPGDSLRRPGWEAACGACHGDEGLMYYRWFHARERLEVFAKP